MGIGHRKEPLVAGHFYHIFSKSIAEYIIFNGDSEYNRMMDTLVFYRSSKPPYNLARYLELKERLVNGPDWY